MYIVIGHCPSDRTIVIGPVLRTGQSLDSSDRSEDRSIIHHTMTGQFLDSSDRSEDRSIIHHTIHPY